MFKDFYFFLWINFSKKTLLQEYQQRKSMNAVKYDSVTIYFSDLVDFIQMVEESSPSEVIKNYFHDIFSYLIVF